MKQKEAGGVCLVLRAFYQRERVFRLQAVYYRSACWIKGLLPVNADHSAYLYSNMLILFAGIVVMSWLVTMNVYKRSQRND